jgi:hypothetical protein
MVGLISPYAGKPIDVVGWSTTSERYQRSGSPQMQWERRLSATQTLWSDANVRRHDPPNNPPAPKGRRHARADAVHGRDANVHPRARPDSHPAPKANRLSREQSDRDLALFGTRRSGYRQTVPVARYGRHASWWLSSSGPHRTPVAHELLPSGLFLRRLHPLVQWHRPSPQVKSETCAELPFYFQLHRRGAPSSNHPLASRRS